MSLTIENENEYKLWLIAREVLLASPQLNPTDIINVGRVSRSLMSASRPTIKTRCRPEHVFIQLLCKLVQTITDVKQQHSFPQKDLAVRFNVFPDKHITLFYLGSQGSPDSPGSFRLRITNEYYRCVYDTRFDATDAAFANDTKLLEIVKKVLHLSREAKTLLEGCEHCKYVQNHIGLYFEDEDYFMYECNQYTFYKDVLGGVLKSKLGEVRVYNNSRSSD
jgi:hypothetical protein